MEAEAEKYKNSPDYKFKLKLKGIMARSMRKLITNWAFQMVFSLVILLQVYDEDDLFTSIPPMELSFLQFISGMLMQMSVNAEM